MQPTRSELIHDRSRPNLRTVYRDLVRAAHGMDVAVDRIRLSGIDLGYEELASVRRLRVLITEINAATLKVEAEVILADPERGRNLRVVMRLLAEERLRVRCAPLFNWAPNFSVFTDARGRCAVLLGAHGFQIPYPSRGPALAMVHGGAQAAEVRARFQEMWELAHDIGPALRGVFEAAERAT